MERLHASLFLRLGQPRHGPDSQRKCATATAYAETLNICFINPTPWFVSSMSNVLVLSVHSGKHRDTLSTTDGRAAAGTRCSSFTNHACAHTRSSTARALEPLSKVMLLCIEAHSHFEPLISGCGICNIEPHCLSKFILECTETHIELTRCLFSLCIFCYCRTV